MHQRNSVCMMVFCFCFLLTAHLSSFVCGILATKSFLFLFYLLSWLLNLVPQSEVFPQSSYCINEPLVL